MAEKRKDLLGVLYDGFVRQHWEELSSKKHSFRVCEHVGEINDTALRRAWALHDTFFGPPSLEVKSARQPVQEVCYACLLV